MIYVNSKIKEFLSLDIIALFLLIITFKLLFIFTGFILEDSFIVFRSAFNLADFGKFSYNLDEINSATTSKIFGLICALFRFLFKDFAIISIIFFNSLVSFFSSLFIYLAIKNIIFIKDDIISKNNFSFLVIIIFLNPSILLIGIVGLEFSILVLFISFLLYAISKNSKILLFSAIFIPLIRMELIAFILIISFFYILFFKWKNFLIIFFAGILGLLLNSYLNFIYDESFFPGPAVSKWNTLGENNTFLISRILDDIHFWFFGTRSFFLGVYSKFIPNIVYLITSIFFLAYAAYNFKYLIYYKYTNKSLNYKIVILTISASIILIPLSYVIGGHVWDWYLYPYSFLSYSLLAIFLVQKKLLNNIKTLIVFLIILISFFQFAVLKNIGFQENSYRSVVGKDINFFSKNHKDDTLFLEPAGYIPFYAKIKTFDTVGLSSPEILKYRNQKNNHRWWLDFIENKLPNFIVDRSNVLNGYSHDGEYKLTKSEIEWFKNNYTLVKNYNYHEYVETYSGSLNSFYKLGNHSDYYLYKKN